MENFKIYINKIHFGNMNWMDVSDPEGIGYPLYRTSHPNKSSIYLILVYVITGRGKSFVLSTSSRPVMEPTDPPIQCVPTALSLRSKRSGREADYPPPTSAEVNDTLD
jgi:hypothetical protein